MKFILQGLIMATMVYGSTYIFSITLNLIAK